MIVRVRMVVAMRVPVRMIVRMGVVVKVIMVRVRGIVRVRMQVHFSANLRRDILWPRSRFPFWLPAFSVRNGELT